MSAALACAGGARDYDCSRAALGELANSCNRCHQSFRVAVHIVPVGEAPAEQPAEPPDAGAVPPPPLDNPPARPELVGAVGRNRKPPGKDRPRAADGPDG